MNRIVSIFSYYSNRDAHVCRNACGFVPRLADLQKNSFRNTKTERVSPRNAVRSVHGTYHSLVRRLRLSDLKGFHGYLRISPTTFETLLGKVGNRLVRVSRRPTISPYERLALTLRYLATGTS